MFEKVAIVGFGRFGKVLCRLLKSDFQIFLFDADKKAFNGFKLSDKTKITFSAKEIYQSQVIFYAVPIETFEKVIKNHQQYFSSQHLLIDVLSVKTYPEKIFNQYLKGTKTQALLTHPMFGPDSAKNSFKDLPIVLNQFKSSSKNYQFWKKYFHKKGLKIVELSSQDHDKMAAYSQGTTHFIGRLLKDFKFEKTLIDTLGAKMLQQVMEQTCKDTWQLFSNLQTYNPYTKEMRWRLGRSYWKIFNKLLPKRVDKKKIVFGIQGGKGSFNEEAILYYVREKKIKDFKIKYLYTTEKVLKNLQYGKIDFGLFAIHNSVGGVVEESAHALARYKVKIVEEFGILIRHFLMKKKEVKRKKIVSITAHPQVFRQCQATLNRKYRELNLTSGQGDLIDTARVALALKKGEIPSNQAILGPKILAQIYGFEIIDKDLQDNKKNITSFFLVARE